jgi:hypothetical protein
MVVPDSHLELSSRVTCGEDSHSRPSVYSLIDSVTFVNGVSEEAKAPL